MGLAPDPVTKEVQKNVELAKQNIELLALLKEKTKGNLTDDENNDVNNLKNLKKLIFIAIKVSGEDINKIFRKNIEGNITLFNYIFIIKLFT